MRIGRSGLKSEYFDYGPGDIPGQGRRQIYELDLPNQVLEQVYWKNALRILGLNGDHE
ncbi:MAG: hypothetical protein U9R25_13575 [Chloroflexota bacterium]|nr:hypothetical protein [Chloroflexota bacterium]